MARHPKPMPEIQQDNFDHEQMAEDVQKINELALFNSQQEVTVRAIATQLGYQLPADCTDPDLIQRDISANMRRSVEACLEVGRGLTVLKAACGHGNFVARLDVLGIEPRVAQKFMQSAAKFANASLTAHLTKALGNQTKLFEMLVLDDEQIEELQLTGQTGELKLDEIATMSVKELRAKLREEREKAAAHGKVLEGKNKLIDHHASEIEVLKRRIETETPDEAMAEMIKAASHVGFVAQHAVRVNLKKAVAELAQQAGSQFTNHAEFVTGLLADVELACHEIREEFGISKDTPDSDPTPVWLRPGADEAGLKAQEAWQARQAEFGAENA